MVLLIVSLFTAALLFGLGFLLNEKSAPSMLSGYRKMSPQEKQHFQLADYVRFFRQFHFVLGSSLFLLSILLFYIHVDAIGMLLGFGPLIAYSIFFLKSRQFYPPSQRKALMIGFYVMLLTALFVGGLFFLGNSSTQVIIGNDAIEISGVYGESIQLKDLIEAKLVTTLPKIKMKLNGFATSNVKKGWFKTTDGRKIKLIIDKKTPPYLYLKTNDGLEIYVAINQVDKSSLLNAIKSGQ